MAGAIDLRAGSNSLSGQNLFQVDKSPLNQIFPGVDDVIGKQAGGTGNILVEIMSIPIDVLNTILDLFGLNPLNTSNSSSLGNSLGGLLKLPMTFLTDLLQLLGLGDGTSSSLSSATGLANVIGLIQPLIDMFVGFLGGSGTGNPLSVLQPLLGNIPLIGQLIGLFPNISSGLTGLTGLGSIFTDLTGLLGSPTGLGSGSPVLPGISSIPLLGPLLSGGLILTNLIPGLDASQIISGTFPAALVQPLIDAISTGFGGSTGLNFGSLTSFLSAIPGAAQVISTLIGAMSPGSALTGTGGLGSVFTDLFNLLGQPTAMGSGSPILPVIGSIPLLGGLLSGGTTLLTSLIPGLDASQIISGTFPAALLQPLLDAISTGYGGSAGLSFSGLQSFLAGLPLVGPLISAMLSGFNTVAGLSGTSGVTSLFTDLSALLGAPTAMGSGTPILPGIGSIPLLGGLLSGGVTLLTSLIPGLDASQIISGQFPMSMITSLATLLGGFGTGTSIISQLLGLWPQAAAGLSGLGGLQSIYTDLMGLLGTPTGLGSGTPVLPGISSIPVLGGLLSGGVTLLTSLIPGLDASKIITGSFPQSMISGLVTLLSGFTGGSSIITQLLSLWPNTTGGLTGLAGLGSIYTDITHLMGSPTALGSGSPLLPGISSIPLLGGLFSGLTFLTSLIPGLDASQIITGQFPQSMVSGLADALANAGANFAQLVAAFIPGMSGGTQTDFTNIAQNILSMLGSPTGLNAGTGFNPVTAGQQMLQQVLTPAGALTSLTQLPGHLFGVLAPNNLSNMLPDPGFDNSTFFDDPTYWDGTVGRSTPLGSLKFTASGTYQQYVGVPIGADSTQVIQFGIYAFWQNLVANPGNAIVLAADAYDTSDNLIPNPAGRVLMAVSNPTAGSTGYPGMAGQPPIPAAGSDGWVYLSGAYMPPAGTGYVRISPEVTANTLSGTVHFDDGYVMPEQGFLDSAVLGNFANLLDGSIPGAKVAGLQGISDIATAFQHHVDGLFNAMNDGPTQTDVPFFTLFDMMQQTALSAGTASNLGATNNNIINNKINKSAITGGLQPSGEMNFSLSGLPDGTTMPTTTLATGQAMAGWIRCSQNASKGFIDFYASKAAAGTTGIFVNLYKQDTSSGARTRVYQSPDIAAVLATSINWAQMLIPGGVSVSANDVLWFELVNNSGANMTVGKRTIPIADNPNTIPRNVGRTRTVATLGVSPASLALTDDTTSQTAPIFCAGIASVPANYHLPQMDTYPPTGSGAGNYIYTIPSFITTGDTLDLIGVGGGGSGMSEWDAGIMAGGVGGSWNAAQFVYGSDIHGTGLPVIPAGTTQLTCVIGVGGPQCSGYWQNGNPGGNTQWWIGTPGSGTLLLDCAGGPGGSGSVGFSNGTGAGPTPNPYMFDGKSYPGGSNVGIDAAGSAPGGGGGGATWYEFGGPGARGGAWVYAQKVLAS